MYLQMIDVYMHVCVYIYVLYNGTYVYEGLPWWLRW